MAETDVSGNGFRARTGVLTLLYVASSMERQALLEMLAGMVLGISDFVAEEIDEGEEEVFDPNVILDPLVVEADEADLEPDGLIGPDTPMRITAAGREMVYVSFSLERWLRNCPEGPTELGEETAGFALTALAGGWATTAIQVLTGKTHSLSELDRAIEGVSYQVLEERVEAMEDAGLLEAYVYDADGETRYEPSTWLCEGIAPLIAATRFERRYPQGDTAPPDRLDVEAAFLLALPLLNLPAEISGSCRLGLQLSGAEPHLAGVTAQVEEGGVGSCSTHLDEDVETWAIGSLEDWLETVIDPDIERVLAGGDTQLAGALLSALHERLFGVPVG